MNKTKIIDLPQEILQEEKDLMILIKVKVQQQLMKDK